ncbi:polyketide synthase [Sulfuriferula plumbiphila]|uniref:Polyketide synthase n=2 Tax=Sulfuriferula plumbiphila TaxID=171865 RepID=A0A512L7G7_9PROT|nr:polyketide synthase [Sulfuriferula plumbiphila]GEP30081.1 polyketide synthase [Sulfuriferula plumbiphila]
MNGRDLVTEVDPERWAQDTFRHPNKNHPGTSYTFAAGSIGDISTFDAGFFGISPREAALMDPQQRLLLEMSWEALENSGIKPSTLHGSQCGVFIGIASADYSYRLADDLAAVDSSVATGNTASIAANRISYVLDLRGPSMAIDTACSSSMVAFHQACRSILSGESTQALAGGVSLHLHPYGFITFSKASMLSRRGRCSVFDASGDGYVRSEGGGIFFLKDYDQAIADGNPILAVVANSAINTDGRKSGLTVPNPKTQAALLEQAYVQAGIDPAAIDYIEAHGTGTIVGDPIEARAIGEALGKRRPKNSPLLIGSVKSNLGHLEAASGVAGLVKALQCIQHRMVPATIGLETPNPNIRFDAWNIEVVTKNRPLKKNGKLIIGVNSFGFGGANAHVILESHEQPQSKTPEHPQDTLLPVILSAKDSVALKAAAREFSAFLKKQPQAALYDIAHNAAFRREWHEHRTMVYGATPKAIAKALLNFANDVPEQLMVETGVALEAPSGVAFIYSGNGSQWAGMGKRLLEEEPLFREAIREVDAIFRRHADYSLEDELAGKNGEGRYQYTEIAQPALFALQVGITQMLRHRGITPVAVAGHSVGEVAAAWASGALTLEAAVDVIYYRSHAQGTTKGNGQMTAVGLGQEVAHDLLAELGLTQSLALAGINSSHGVTIAGSPKLLTRLESALNERDIFNKRLDLDYAFHSPAMDEIETSVRQTLAELQPSESLVPFYSTVTGNLLDGTELNAEYWWHNIRKPVLFKQAIKSILDGGINIFIEIGPHAVLRSYINDCLTDLATEGRIIPTVARGDDAPQRVWGACSQAVIAGASIDWQRVFSWPGRFVRLPNYPWQRERHWHPVMPESIGLLDRRKVHPLLGYPLQQHELTWENQLDTKLNPTLADHVVGEATIFPGTGFSELALAAALAWHPGDLAEIEELEIRSPLLLSDDHAMLVRLSIEAQDGSLTIKGREHVGTEPWTLHAVGRILRDPRDILLRQESPVLPTRQPDFNSASHEALTQAAGLAYGPAFQCIDYGWVEDNSVLAVFKTPESIETELEHTHLHPALLDCTFQLIIQLLKEDLGVHDGITFVPTKMGRIAFRASKAKPSLARATLLRRTSHSLTAEFTVFDTDGVTIAVVKEARFRSIRLSKNAADHLRFLDYHGTPKPHAFTPDATPTIAFERVQSAIAELAKRAALKGSHRRYSEEVDPLLDSLCSRFTRQALQLLSTDGQKLSSQEILAFQTANPEIKPFLDHLLTLAEDDQTMAKSQDGWTILPDQDNQASAQDIWNSLVADYPDYFQIVHSVGRIGMHLKSLLEGGLTLAQTCPQESSLATLTRQVLGAESKQNVGRALRDLIARGMNQLPEGQRLGIVEISEGSPSFAMDACVAMDFNCCDYAFASTSAATLEDAARLKERFPAIETHLTDTTGDQYSIAPLAACQIAIVTLDFSTLEEAMGALEYARTCLAPGGSLIVIGQHPSRWIDFVFGGQRKNWSPSENGTWLSNQRTALFWQQQLQQPDFSSADIFELSPDTLSGPYLLLAQLAESALSTALSRKAMPRSWVLLADQNGYSAQLSDHLTKKLQARGDLVVQACPGDTAHIESLLLDTTASYGQLDGIVHLAGLSPQPAKAEAEAVLDQQVARCATAASIIQACETTLTNTTCWLITTGAATDLLPHRGPAETPVSAIIPVDAALWGFGRTLINEASNYTIRLVDLEDPLAIETVATALDREFEQPDNEQEIILTRRGARYAPRLRLEPRPLPQEHHEIESPTIRLGFQLPGQLRNLRWEAHARSAPADDEIEVEVHATGLNFRDVMYALGLLSDEAIENGFAGPTLGLEFSGTVRSVGSKACGFAPGDQVVGFGPSSFGNRVITQASAISHIPPGISFEAAATIPSTFFTVYYALHHLARLQPGEKVLIHGAAGGVGIAAIQLAKWIGAEIYVTAGSDEKRDFLRLLGVDHIFDSRSLAFADEILAQTDGKGVDVVLNSLAGEAINRNLRVLKPFGRFLELGKRDFYENTKIGLRPFRNNISYFGIDADQLMQSRPGLTRSLFAEVMALFTEGVLHPLPYHVFEAEDIVDAFRYMQQARQIGKIVITYRNGISQVHTPSPATRKHLILAADASYLVTGGLGGFGLRTAEWLVSKGARNLVLISRSGPSSEEARNAIGRLEKQGVNVHAASCDITDKNAISALLAEIAKALPPLKGIVHAATVINDGLIRNMDADQIRSVLAPKALGAHYLHEMTLDTPLDFFILFSSATTLFGNPGQGNYVAANACLEALAKHRRATGLAATCVRWGAIDDVGFLARNKKIKDALQSRMGGSALNSAVALDALESLLLADRSGLGILELDWKALARFLPSARTSKFSEMGQHGGDSDADEDNSENIQRLLTELSDTELLASITKMIKSEVGEIIRVSPDKIDATRSIYDMGLDSLMGVELVIALEARFSMRLPVMALSESPTIAKLAERMIVQLKGSEEVEINSSEANTRTQVQQVAAQHGAEVTAESIASLVEDIQSRGGAPSNNRMIR